MGLIQKVFGTHSQHELKRIYPIVDHIEALEPEMQKLSDEELRDKTREYKERYAKGETLDDLLPEAVCDRERGGCSFHWDETLPCAAHRWYRTSSGAYCRDEDR